MKIRWRGGRWILIGPMFVESGIIEYQYYEITWYDKQYTYMLSSTFSCQ